ncbi:MAG TPA: insulinase family protein [Kofleriaceae bacterium]
MRRGVSLACVAVLAGCALAKPPPPAPIRSTNLGLTIKTVTLGNGLRVVIVNDPHASEVQVTMRYRVGAGDDLEYPGIAHLVEHLMFQQVLGSQTLFAHLEDNATFFNATTTFDATTYVSRARPDFLDKLLSIEAVRLGFRCTSITDSAFEREREVVVQEEKLKDFAKEIRSVVHSAVFPDGHPYRGTGGSATSVSAITRAQACTFADAYYSPDNAALVISGNVSPAQIEAALGKFLARVAKRVAAAPASVPPARQQPTQVIAAPIDSEVLLVSWPLPTDPGDQIGVRMVAQVAAGAVDNAIKGSASYIVLGDVRAPVVGVLVEPGKGETIQGVLDKAQEVFEKLPTELEAWYQPQFVFDLLQQQAIYSQFASLEDGSDRDSGLAEHTLAGRDPAQALGSEFAALRRFGRKQAAGTARRHLSFANVSIATFKPAAGKKAGRSLVVKAATHDMGQRRSVPDVARAQHPDTTIAVPSVNVRTRVLPNGLKVVLLPLSTVPTIDARLVFGAGTADEPADRRGAALVAAHALTFDMQYLADVMSFVTAGGSVSVDVTRDRTSFIVRGLDMHLDYLLAGLRRWSVDGRYDGDADKLVESLQRHRKRADDYTALQDAWQASVYGAQHPYARAGFERYTATNLTVEDAERFRAANFTPDNATLVIAGRVDVVLAERWIDFLFAEWKGTAQPRRLPQPQPEPASLAKLEDLTQLLVVLALPAQSGTRAQRLVATELLDEIANDVRHQLAAAYSFDAGLDESRIASTYVMIGWIDPARANDVAQLLRDRIARLRDDPDAAARAFVAARSRVIAKLASVTGSASLLAERAQADIELARPPLSDLQTAKAVQQLTFDQLKPILAELDLSRAVVLMRGPDAHVKSAFQLLGREPTLVALDQAALDADEPIVPLTKSKRSRDQRLQFYEMDYAITDQGPATKGWLELDAFLAYTGSTLNNTLPPGQSVPIEGGPGGPSIGAEVGLRFRARFSAGLHASLGYLSGTYPMRAAGVEFGSKSYSLIPIDLGAYLHMQPLDKFWAGFLLGVHTGGLRFDTDREWNAGLGFGFEAGYDVMGRNNHWLSVMLRATASRGTDLGGTLGIGVAYRR